MLYRIVLQGRAAGYQDLAKVKREFSRVTGLPDNVTDRLFAQTPNSLKERLAQADAERIAATLRAIGAAVTVERDLLASLDSVDGVQEIMAPEHRGPPTVLPGSENVSSTAPPTAAPRWRRRLRPYLLVLVVAPLAIAALIVGVPLLTDAFHALRPARVAPPAPVKLPPAEAPAPPAPPSAAVLHGPWRCTDQRTGLSAYWTFGADGTLTFYGDTFKEGAARTGDPAIPSGWKLAGDRLVLSYPQQPPVTYSVRDLSISRLRYGDGRDVDIQCRRP